MAFADYKSLADSSRTWIYRSDRKLSKTEEVKVEEWILQFIDKWTAHNQTLRAFGKVYHSQFLVIFLDEESSTQASGCSIDAQVRFIKEVGNALDINFFDRMHFDFIEEEKIISFHKDEIAKKIEIGVLREDSLSIQIILVKSKKDFENVWSVPLNKSWHFAPNLVFRSTFFILYSDLDSSNKI